jgi:hypothetical protein
MDIYVLDGLNGVKDILENFKSSIWDVQYSGTNEFQLICPATEKNLSLLTYGAYLVRSQDATANGFQNVMVCENIKIDISFEEGWLLTVTGRGLKSILERRIVWGQKNISGRAESSIRSLITSEVISPSIAARAIPNFILGADKSLQKTLETQLFGENLGSWIQETCSMLGYGWDVSIESGNYVFQIYEGTNRTNGASRVVFSPTFDNLLSSSYQNNREAFQNAALIGGEGEGTAKRTADIGTASGLDRFEAYIDGSSVSSNGEIITLETYINMLKGYGKTQLSQKQFSEKFEGEVEPSGIFKLNEDYFLGDLVLVENELGITAISRINEIIYAEDENGSSVVPTFSEWEVEE